jgi:hypothetical protein
MRRPLSKGAIRHGVMRSWFTETDKRQHYARKDKERALERRVYADDEDERLERLQSQEDR